MGLSSEKEKLGIEFTFKLNLPSKRHAEIVYKAIKPETLTPPSYRSRASISMENTTITLKITATDFTSLRAAVNSFLKLLKVSKELIDNLKR